MQERSGQILTASKDASVAISALRPSGDVVRLRLFEDHHDGVVKSARWSPTVGSGIFASCGVDRCALVKMSRGNLSYSSRLRGSRCLRCLCLMQHGFLKG